MIYLIENIICLLFFIGLYIMWKPIDIKNQSMRFIIFLFIILETFLLFKRLMI